MFLHKQKGRLVTGAAFGSTFFQLISASSFNSRQVVNEVQNLSGVSQGGPTSRATTTVACN
jgi:hypothetical protein